MADMDDSSSSTDDVLATAQTLKNRAMHIATGGPRDDPDYARLRQALCARSDVRPYLPRFLTICRDPGEFWAFIQPQFGSYRERRDYLNGQFEPLLAHLEQADALPAQGSITATLNRVDSQHVRAAWQKAVDRRTQDPAGAITVARTLLESVCKHILDEEGVSYPDKEDLPGLYWRAARQVRLAPDQHTEQGIRRLLGNCQAIVQEVGVLRNRMGDAHGRSKGDERADARHAELAVNLAGTVATFLVATWEDQDR
jgi:hypothetical protein